MLDSIYHMTLKLLKNHIFGVIILCHVLRYVIIKSLHNDTKSVIHSWFINFIAWRYITPICDVM